MTDSKVSDIVYLHGLHCKCTIGVWEWEKSIKQRLVLDVDIATDISNAAKNDDLSKALDYQAVANRIQTFAETSAFELIETLAEKLAQLILAEFDANWVRIKLDKGQAVTDVKHVGVLIERSKQ